ncbi:unnamed protein product [Ixodes hexagonus]
MSNHITANGTNSPSLLNTLRNFRFQKKFSQDSPNAETSDQDSVEMAEKQSPEPCQSDSSSKTPPPHDLVVIPETPESALRKAEAEAEVEIVSAPEGDAVCSAPQDLNTTTDMDESPIVCNGVKRKRILSSESEEDENNPKPPTREMPTPSPTNESNAEEEQKEEEEDSEEDLDDCTRYMTSKERCLKRLMDRFKGADVMELQDALVRSDWDVDKTLAQLEKSPPSRKSGSPHRNSHFKTVSTPKGKGVSFEASQERELTPKVKLRAEVVTKPGESSEESASTGGPKKGMSKFKAFNNLKSREADPSNKQGGRKKGKRSKTAADESDDDDYRNEDIYGSADDSDASAEEDETPAKAEARRAVTEFFDTATINELSAVPGCTKKKAEVIVQNRPYKTWKTLVYKMETVKGMSPSLLNGAKNVLHMRGVVSRLLSKCQGIADRMQEIVSRLVSGSEESEGYIKEQPSILNDSLRLSPYQLIGLNWLAVMHKQEVNGILADEMGLGKTIQAIAFLAYLLQQKENGPHLIVVPSSTLENWMRELQLWCPSLDVLVYHGSQEDRRELKHQILDGEVGTFHVLVTTYHMVSGSAEDRSLFKKLPFNYVIFDEAHMLKNMASQRYNNLMKINAKRKILLTGTPLQNNLVELMSLLTFVMPRMFCNKAEQIKLMFTSAAKTEEDQSRFERDRVAHAKKIMRPFVLRRLKRDVLQQLPTKHEEERLVPMTPYQTDCYVNLVAALSKEFRETQEGGTGMMMKLRRASNHPLLLRVQYDADKLRTMSKLMLQERTHHDADPERIFEDMEVMSDFELHTLCTKFQSLHNHRLEDDQILDSGKLRELDCVLSDCMEKNHRVLIFSQFTMVLDILEAYLQIRGHKWLRLDGSTSVAERQDLIDKYNGDSSILAFLLSTRAGGQGINLASANVVVLHDVDFNPYNDKQAEDRCHRLGQNRDVFVIRFVSKDTIEEGILTIAKEKLKLEKDITEETINEDVDSFSVAQLLKSALGN